ncbi:hypothetical protein Taro_022784 [Colocasia esculenta]|uniref:Retrotransposon gag domain-containing protein n=1 Tax=Colocasia esculenta TaxID=4460 RepID=A0A843V2H7_COLES|nr:hypothetical protein [Colocasia esculenta]
MWPVGSEMADRRDWGGGGDEPKESTHQWIERLWESIIEIWTQLDQQPPVQPAVVAPPVEEEAVPVSLGPPPPPPPGVEVPHVVPLPPVVPVRSTSIEVSTLLVERFLWLQPPTYSGGPNPNIAVHWVHEIERVFITMRCPQADRVILATYQLRGFAQEWWRLKMQTVFAGRAEDTITWPKILEVFNNTFFPVQI